MKTALVELDYPMHVSLARLMGARRDVHTLLPVERSDSELQSLEEMDVTLMSRADFMTMCHLDDVHLTVPDVLGLVRGLSDSTRRRRIAGLLVDMPLQVSKAEKVQIVQGIKGLLSAHVRVILVDGDGYCVNLSEVDAFCTTRDFVDIYMEDLFSVRWSFAFDHGPVGAAWVERAWQAATR